MRARAVAACGPALLAGPRSTSCESTGTPDSIRRSDPLELDAGVGPSVILIARHPDRSRTRQIKVPVAHIELSARIRVANTAANRGLRRLAWRIASMLDMSVRDLCAQLYETNTV
jgi:hypothetical protein